jgi:hypothetical protein
VDESFILMMIEGGRHWIAEQRQQHRESGVPLPVEARAGLATFFDARTLDSARFALVDRIRNPPFFSQLPAVPLDFSVMIGITFVDTVLLSQAAAGLGPQGRTALLFHELVHVVQYEILGLDEFAKQYVRGWAENGEDYFAIPLEKMAYDLGARYEKAPTAPFSVRAEVERQLDRRN